MHGERHFNNHHVSRLVLISRGFIEIFSRGAFHFCEGQTFVSPRHCVREKW
jgi:hypothetical protein